MAPLGKRTLTDESDIRGFLNMATFNQNQNKTQIGTHTTLEGAY